MLCTVVGLVPLLTFVFVGPSIVRKDLTAATAHMETLRTDAQNWLAVPKFKLMQAAVQSLQSSLDHELKTRREGNWCGVGDGARSYINEMKQYLPDMDVIRGTDKEHRCSKTETIDGIAVAYQEKINDLLEHSPLAVTSDVKGRETLLESIEQKSTDMIARLTHQLAEVSSVSIFLGSEVYAPAAAVLVDARETYRDSIGRVANVPQPNTMPIGIDRDLDISHSIAVGSSVEVIRALVTGKNAGMWLAVVLSVILDLAAVASVYGIAKSYRTHGLLILMDRVPSRQVGGVDVL